ncbi:MAG: hypothetical protein HKM86_06285, partial [Deltaproteobacteria bacterium]|nr:hypothetical protein [Deltaproteobacteria bacterium]
MLRFSHNRRFLQREDIPLGYGIRWTFPFWAVWAGVVAVTVLSIALTPGGFHEAGLLAWIAVGGEFVLGAALYLYLNDRIFRPAARWRREVSSGSGEEFPVEAGLFTPVAAAVGERYGREIASLGEEIRTLDEKLRQFEHLRRDLEETQSHLEDKIQDLHSIYEVSTAIAGTLDTDELFRIIPERVMK